jgi:hypothetical protein
MPIVLYGMSMAPREGWGGGGTGTGARRRNIGTNTTKRHSGGQIRMKWACLERSIKEIRNACSIIC